MPLPPAPTKRAALLSKDALDTPVRPLAKPAGKLEPVARPAKNSAGTERSRQDLELEHEPPKTEKRSPSPVKTLAGKSRKPKSSGPKKLFVLDTNVLMHDPMCLFRFEEHDIFLPMIVLEELDGHKKGMTEVARNARQTSQTIRFWVLWRLCAKNTCRVRWCWCPRTSTCASKRALWVS